jgi:hypothetical protein
MISQYAPEVGQLLLNVMESSSLVTIHRNEEGLHLSAKNDSGTVSRHSGDDLLDLLRAATGLEPQKQCRSCNKMLRLTDYARSSESSDGRLSRCKQCERERVRSYSRRKANR